MITDFDLYGFWHIFSIVIPTIIGLLFIYITRKYPNNKKLISILLAITIILIRAVRYVFDINIGVFQIRDIFSLHVCNIDLILLIICLIKPNNKIFLFNFLIGIPTALAVALFPGRIHPEPGLIRAIFFIMSHMMLVMGALYLKYTYKFEITKKNLIRYYMYSFIGIIVMYIFDTITNSNYMYLLEAPNKTILYNLYNLFGPILYVISIYIILILLLTILYYISMISIVKWRSKQ